MRTAIIFLIVVVITTSLFMTGCKSGVPPPPPPPSSPQVTPSPPISSSPVIDKMITPIDSPKLPSRGFYMGFLPTPAEGQSFADVYQKASKYAEFTPVWGRPTPFYKMATELSGDWGQTFLKQYIRANGMFPIVHMSFIGAEMSLESPPNITKATLDNQEWRKAYKQAALDIVRNSRPLYLSLGNEVNRWYEQYGTKSNDPNGFQHYVSLYNDIYDAIKELSPQTKIFCIFAREIVSQNREADLTVIEMFDANKMDLLVFTSYPYSVKGIGRPERIPNDYYTKALAYMPGKPVGLSELGWAALEPFGGEQAQADFVIQAASRLALDQGINLELFGWAWLSALDNNDAVALVKRDGNQRPAYKEWQKLFTSTK